jgi:hypothetical protein
LWYEVERAGILLKFNCLPFGGSKILLYNVTSNCSKKFGLGFHNNVLYFLLTFLFYSLVLHHNFEFFFLSVWMIIFFSLSNFTFSSLDCLLVKSNIINHFQTNGLDCTIILIMMLVVEKSCSYNSDHKKKTFLIRALQTNKYMQSHYVTENMICMRETTCLFANVCVLLFSCVVLLIRVLDVWKHIIKHI